MVFYEVLLHWTRSPSLFDYPYKHLGDGAKRKRRREAAGKAILHCRPSGAECMMLGRRFMACKRSAQEVAVIGDNFMLPERPRRVVELCVAVKCERKTAIVAGRLVC